MSLYVTVQAGNTAADLAQGSTYTEREVKSFARIAKSPLVLQPAIDVVGLETTTEALAQRVTVTVPAQTAILDVAILDTDAERAAATANAIAEQLVATVTELAPRTATGTSTVQATIICPAKPPTSWTSPNAERNMAIGVLAGLAAGAGQAWLRR